MNNLILVEMILVEDSYHPLLIIIIAKHFSEYPGVDL